MPQTLLALLAIVILTTFSLQQQRRNVYVQQELIKNEISAQALAVAVDRLERIGRMPFDDRIIGEKYLTAATQLTHPDSFRADAPSNDVDDFNGVTTDTFRVIGTSEVYYGVDTKVTYASGVSPHLPVADRTKYKKATVRVYPLVQSGINDGSGILARDTVELDMTYSCGSWCTW